MISGVYVPLLTPFDHQGQVDTGAFGAFAQWLASRGVDGLVPFGSTGEGPSLSMRGTAGRAGQAPGRGAGDVADPGDHRVQPGRRAGVRRRGERAARDRDHGLPPYYFRPLASDDLRRFIEPVLAASRHPVLLYHIPQFGPPVPVDALTALAGPSLWGVKDSGGDIANTKAVLDGRGQRHGRLERTLVEAVGLGRRGRHLRPGQPAARAPASRLRGS